MPDRAVVTEVTQLGVETTSGTAVTGSKLPLAFMIDLETAAEFDKFAPSGQILDTIVVPRREWASFALRGYPDYASLVYPLAGVIGAPVITTPGGGTLSRLWTYTLSSAGVNTPKTFTIERGDSNTIEKAAYGLFNSLTLGFSRAAAQSVAGGGIAQRLDYTAALTASPTQITPIPILAGQVDVYADDTAAGLGTTKLTRDFTAEFGFADRWNPIWPINSALPSFAAHVQQRPGATLKVGLGNDAAGRAYVDLMRAGTTKFFRIEAIGAIIEGALPYRLRIDMAVKLEAAPSRADVNGLSVLNWGGRIVHDATWGKGLEISLQNTLTAL